MSSESWLFQQIWIPTQGKQRERRGRVREVTPINACAQDYLLPHGYFTIPAFFHKCISLPNRSMFSLPCWSTYSSSPYCFSFLSFFLRVNFWFISRKRESETEIDSKYLQGSTRYRLGHFLHLVLNCLVAVANTKMKQSKPLLG